MLKGFVSVVLLLWVCGAAAQHPDDGYYPYPYPEREERQRELATDSTLFYRAVQSVEDLYGRTADFNLPRVALKRRGQSFDREQATIGAITLPYRSFGALRLLGADEVRTPGIAPVPETAGGAGGVRLFRFVRSEPLQPYYASVHFTDRNYLFGAKFSADRTWNHGWRGGVALDLRTGRDMYAQGVFTNALTPAFRLAKSFGEGHSLSLLIVVPASVRGTRLSTTDEAFTLTGDPFYNPAWGLQGGKVRNSRVRRELLPFAVVSYQAAVSASTSLEASLGVEAGVSRYSMLGWYDARTPMPDNYRYMPSWTGDRETELAWRTGDVRYTQIDWDELIRRNRLTQGHAVYALEDRAERLCRLDLGVNFTTELSPRLTLFYGGWLRHRTTRSYKQMRDLLGAQYIVDIDQYLVDDDAYGNLLQNDLRNPSRTIGRGDRFGYDYAFTRRDLGARVHAEYRSDRFRADVVLSLGAVSVRRRGFYEKELFPGAGSYGLSQRIAFTPYTLKALAGWAFSPRHYLQFAVMAAAAPPDDEALFYQPQYNNRTVENPSPEQTYAVEAMWRRSGSVVNVQLTAFATASLDGMQTMRYYDDLSGVFCDAAVTGLGEMAWGMEAAAALRLSYRWRLSLAVSAGRYYYIRDPLVTVLSDVDNTLVDQRAQARMGGVRVGGAPQFTGCAGFEYFGPKGWGGRLSAGYAAGRYVTPAVVRRTERVIRQGGLTAEAFEALVSQERLGDAFTLDASLYKSFLLGRSRLVASLMLRNLTGHKAVYSGYESLRLRRIRAGDRTFREPQATRYTWAGMRSFYLTISYRF